MNIAAAEVGSDHVWILLDLFRRALGDLLAEVEHHDAFGPELWTWYERYARIDADTYAAAAERKAALTRQVCDAIERATRQN